jgi:2'-5' RNA ligase
MTDQAVSSKPSTEPLRLFIAVELPAKVRTALTALQDRLRAFDHERAIRWTSIDGIHLTLKFLGDTPAVQCAAIEAGLRGVTAEHSALSLHVEGVGCFPTTRRPRVVWAGVGGDLAALRDLQEGVERAITPLGFPREDRAFIPHLTLGRARQGAPPAALTVFGAQVERLAAAHERGPQWRVAAVSLMRSELKPSGAVYTQLAIGELVPGR